MKIFYSISLCLLILFGYSRGRVRAPLYPDFGEIAIYSDCRTKIEEVIFRGLNGAAYRASKPESKWCYDRKHQNGRSYQFEQFIGLALNVVDLTILLQFDETPKCEETLFHFREFLYNIKNTTTRPTELQSWFTNEFNPKLLDAFSCGFDSKQELEEIQDLKQKNKAFDLPFDIRENFEKKEILQKSWRLMKDYLTSTQKKHENPLRVLDYDVSLYLAFLEPHVAEQSSHYGEHNLMRVGFPTYFGTSVWFWFHVWAQRISDISYHFNADEKYVNELIIRFINTLSFFLHTTPCPYCREHFLTSVSKNDVYWRKKESYQQNGEKQVFEMDRYPLEWIYIGITDHDKQAELKQNILTRKLLSIKNANDLNLFFWKLHNAVSSSVDNREDC